MPTPAQLARRAGFRDSLRVRGREMITNTDETVTAIVDDAQPHDNPTNELQAKRPVFAFVFIAVGAVASPRDILHFRETDQGGRNYRVLGYAESAADGVSWKFECEAQRLNVPADDEPVEPE